MQKVLHFTQGKKKYVSKPWDFEAFVRVHEMVVRQDQNGAGYTNSVPRICSSAVDYLFEGTNATQDILDAARGAKFSMCLEVWRWFNEDMEEINAKNSQAPAETAEEA